LNARCFSLTHQEFRVEEYFPPYAMDSGNAPAITSINGVTNPAQVVSATHGGTLDIAWAPKLGANGDLVPVTSVALVAPSSTTHAYNSNQRLIWLPVINTALNPSTMTGTLTVRLPSSTAVAPPQVRMR
jgi:hypothetical protein